MALSTSITLALSHQYLLQSKNYISLHVDVKERTFLGYGSFSVIQSEFTILDKKWWA